MQTLPDEQGQDEPYAGKKQKSPTAPAVGLLISTSDLLQVFGHIFYVGLHVFLLLWIVG